MGETMADAVGSFSWVFSLNRLFPCGVMEKWVVPLLCWAPSFFVVL